MFSELKLRNFQSLSEASLKLGPVNVIIGPSFLGKSAVVRALYCLCRNRFESSFMKKGTSQTQIMVAEDDKWVTYKRDSSSQYEFYANSEPYTKIGRDVPQDIRSFLQMDEIVFDTDLSLDFNFQRQFDQPFILSLSGFEIAKVFGKLMNLDIVMSASREIDKDIRALNKEKDEQLAIQSVSIQYIQKNYVIEYKYALLHEALQLDAEEEALLSKGNTLLDLVSEIYMTEKQIDLYQKLLNTLEDAHIDNMQAPMSGFEDTFINLLCTNAEISIYQSLLTFDVPDFDTKGLIALRDAIVEGRSLTNESSLYSSLLASSEDIDFVIVSRLENLSSVIEEGNKVNSDFSELKQNIIAVDQNVAAKQEEFASYIKANNICPLSKLPFTEACIKAISGGV